MPRVMAISNRWLSSTGICLALVAMLLHPQNADANAPKPAASKEAKQTPKPRPAVAAKPAAVTKSAAQAKPSSASKSAAPAKATAATKQSAKPATTSKPANPTTKQTTLAKPTPPKDPVTTGSVRAAEPKAGNAILQPATRQHVVQPRGPVAAPAALASASSTSQGDIRALAQVMSLLERGNPADATQVAQSITESVASKAAEWAILRSTNNRVSTERYRAFFTANPSWPLQSFLRRRAESALWDDRRDNTAVLAYFSSEEPLTAKGKLSLARAVLERGDRATATRLVRDAWRNDAMSADIETMALDMFSPLLSAGDHKARMDLFLYTKDNEPGMRAAQRLGSGHVALARARAAGVSRAANTEALLNAVPRELRNDPGYIFAKAQQLRRADKFQEAAQVLKSAPRNPALLHNVDEWWIERRLIARKLLDENDPRAAYIVARDAALPAREVYKTEQEFTAGWIALRFLNDASTASQHFARIGVGSVNPTTASRAGYWQGRAAEAMRDDNAARRAYSRAAAHHTSYYGQLARAKLGINQLELHGPQPATGIASRLEVVRAAQLFYAVDQHSHVLSILADAGENGDANVIAGLADAAARNNDARGLLIIGKAAVNRGMPFDHYSYPVVGLPSYRPLGPEVERGLTFAIARQESGFNPNIVSPASAYGLMQVTPNAARYVTKRHGGSYDLNKLKGDPVYNTMLGAAELGGLLEDYRGSLIMTFAGYNAGRGSVRKWIERYGDPRDANVDAIDWVEKIPFAETRNYVQRIMENLQVYRARFGGGSRLLIAADMQRGAAK